MDLTGKLGQGHSSLYRAISLRSQDVETRIVEARIEEARTDWDNAGTILAALQQWVRSDAAREALGPAGAERETALLGDTSGALSAYVVVGREAADFVAVDAFVATMYVNGAQAKYADAQAKVATIIADLNR
jgi:hypothetical protein